ncbi:MAG: type IV pilus assembly protein PilM [Planctomycetes bacterium]|nr:type IV pilus assembly protein PilM [Planctomycetota bacterium]MBI3845061.1 type IV pilus assembly protein PilM [Planctomycetota bacterium]
MFRKTKSVIGLDIGNHSVKAIELTSHGSTFALTACAQTDLAGEEDRARAVANLLRSMDVHTKRTVTAVSGKSVIVRYLSMIPMTDDELGKAIEFEADKYIPFDVSEVVMDHQKLSNGGAIETHADGGDKMRVLLVAAKRTLVDEAVRMVENAGLQPEIIDVDAFALGNAFEFHRLLNPEAADAASSVAALVDIGSKKTSVNILRGSDSYFTREIYLGGDEFTSAVAKKLGLRPEEAEEFKKHPGERENELVEATAQTLEDLGNEILLSLDYYENQFESRVEEIYLSGGGSLLPRLVDTFQRVFNRPTRHWNPLENLAIQAASAEAESLSASSPQWAVAVGLASRMRMRKEK